MNSDMQDALQKLLAGMSLQLVQSFTSRFDPDAMVNEASQRIGLELRAAFKEVLENTDSDATQKLLDDLFEAIDLDQVISSISKPLANSLAEWFKEGNLEDLVSAIIAELDFDSLAELVAEKVAAKIQFGS